TFASCVPGSSKIRSPRHFDSFAWNQTGRPVRARREAEFSPAWHRPSAWSARPGDVVFLIADHFEPGKPNMSHTNKIGPIVATRTASPRRSRNRAAPRTRIQVPRRSPPRVERLEDRVTPSILNVFELDGNVTTGVLGSSGSTTTSHDWDQVFAN